MYIVLSRHLIAYTVKISLGPSFQFVAPFTAPTKSASFPVISVKNSDSFKVQTHNAGSVDIALVVLSVLSFMAALLGLLMGNHLLELIGLMLLVFFSTTYAVKHTTEGNVSPNFKGLLPWIGWLLSLVALATHLAGAV